jgi:hypothetical protein
MYRKEQCCGKKQFWTLMGTRRNTDCPICSKKEECSYRLRCKKKIWKEKLCKNIKHWQKIRIYITNYKEKWDRVVKGHDDELEIH